MIKYTHFDITFQEVPDETTLVFSISNCPFRCVGCHSTYLWEDIGDSLEKNYQSIIEKYKNYITCVCLMGGDRDPEEVTQIFKKIKDQYPTLKTCWYSGGDNMVENKDIEYYDYIKLHQYKKDLGGLNSKTTNQRFYKVNSDRSVTDITYLFQKKERP